METEAPPATLQEQVDEQAERSRTKFGTFGGVFTPTLLTILGVIMYLREGWVVGNAGLVGAWGIIMLAILITAFTGLSMSSITTNIRIGAGGHFPLSLAIAGIQNRGEHRYTFVSGAGSGCCHVYFWFREGWQRIFPDHPALLIDFATFFVLFCHCLSQRQPGLSHSVSDHGHHCFVTGLDTGNCVYRCIAISANAVWQLPGRLRNRVFRHEFLACICRLLSGGHWHHGRGEYVGRIKPRDEASRLARCPPSP